MTTKYINIIFLLITLTQTSCHAAAYWHASARPNNTKKIENMTQQTQRKLFHAIFSNNISALNQAIEDGANVNKLNRLGFTPLKWAVMCERTTIIVELLKNGADVDNLDKDGNTPLMEAATRHNEQVLQALLDGGADIALTNRNNEKALDIAKKYGIYTVIPILENRSNSSAAVDGGSAASGYESRSD